MGTANPTQGWRKRLVVEQHWHKLDARSWDTWALEKTP